MVSVRNRAPSSDARLTGVSGAIAGSEGAELKLEFELELLAPSEVFAGVSNSAESKTLSCSLVSRLST